MIGSAAGGALSSKRNLTSYQLIGAACIIVVGCGLLSTIPGTKAISASLYGYEVILGFGIGVTFPSYTVLMALSNNSKNVGKSYTSTLDMYCTVANNL